MSRLLLLLALAVAASALALPRVPRGLTRGRPHGGFLRKNREATYPRTFAAVQGEFRNRVDHFGNNTATYSQRYWYNKQWYKPGGPVFFMLGGESAEDPSWTEASTLEWTSMAVERGAWVFLAEHRYYGLSRPTSDMSTKNLVYLSSAQALEDYADFIKGMIQKFPDIANAKWVTFGGSYSGALAAWLRLKHPELVAMAVGSSGPVQAEVDFVEYLEVVQNSITRNSAACGSSVTAGFNYVASLMNTTSGRAQIKSTFNLCQDLNINDPKQIQTFWSTIYGPYMEVVQYSGDNAGAFENTLTVSNAICRFHLQNKTLLQKMQNVNNFFNYENFYFGCSDITYNDFISWMQDTSYGEAQDSRAWVWQTCTEFGYYQSTDSPTAGPWFGGIPNLPVKYYTDQCADIYGSAYNSAEIAAAVAQTNQYYGGRNNLASSNILLPNGNCDPWHALGKLTSNQSTIVPVVIDGTAHCADMYPSASTDLPSLTAARQTIKTTLYSWLDASN